MEMVIRPTWHSLNSLGGTTFSDSSEQGVPTTGPQVMMIRKYIEVKKSDTTLEVLLYTDSGRSTIVWTRTLDGTLDRIVDVAWEFRQFLMAPGSIPGNHVVVDAAAYIGPSGDNTDRVFIWFEVACRFNDVLSFSFGDSSGAMLWSGWRPEYAITDSGLNQKTVSWSMVYSELRSGVFPMGMDVTGDTALGWHASQACHYALDRLQAEQKLKRMLVPLFDVTHVWESDRGVCVYNYVVADGAELRALFEGVVQVVQAPVPIKTTPIVAPLEVVAPAPAYVAPAATVETAPVDTAALYSDIAALKGSVASLRQLMVDSLARSATGDQVVALARNVGKIHTNVMVAGENAISIADYTVAKLHEIQSTVPSRAVRMTEAGLVSLAASIMIK